MNYPLIYNAVYCEPLCIDPSVFYGIHGVLWPRITQGKGMEIGDISAATRDGKPAMNAATGKRATRCRALVDGWTGKVLDERFFYTVEGKPSVAVIPIYGILAKNASSMEELCMGVTDINPISYALAQAAGDPSIKTFVLDIASPGGQVTGIRELANQVRAIAKTRGRTVYAFTDERQCSAAQWIGAQANECYGTPSSTVGSIGTYLAWLDETVKMQLEGTRLEFFGAGKHKGMGLSGRPLSQEDRQLLQLRVDEINGWFTAAVTAARPRVAVETMQGQVFSGEQGVRVHLLDGLVNDWHEFLSLL